MGTLIRKRDRSGATSQPFECALRALVLLADRPRAPVSSLEMASLVHVSAGYLQQILRSLARAGILGAKRGTGGGFTLIAEPRAIRVLDVWRVMSGEYPRIRRCPLGIEGHESLCRLHRMLDQTMAHTQRLFGATTIADLVEDGRRVDPGAAGLRDPHDATDRIAVTLPATAPCRERNRTRRGCQRGGESIAC